MSYEGNIHVSCLIELLFLFSKRSFQMFSTYTIHIHKCKAWIETNLKMFSSILYSVHVLNFILNSNKQCIQAEIFSMRNKQEIYAFCIACAKRNENHFLFCSILFFSVKIFKYDLITSSEINDSTAWNKNYKKARKAKFCSSMDTHTHTHIRDHNTKIVSMMVRCAYGW